MSEADVRSELLRLQRRAAFTRRAIYRRRAQGEGLSTSELEQRLSDLQHRIALLHAQLPPKQ